MNIRDLQKQVHATATRWPARPIPEALCHIHSEISEAYEAHRNGKVGSVAENLADAAILIFDLAENMGLDIQSEIIRKDFYNQGR